MIYPNRELHIELTTDHPETVAYLHGYLTGIHDVGWIRRQKSGSTSGNKHVWKVDVNEPKITFNSMSSEEIEEDLNRELRLNLEDLIHNEFQQIEEYKLHVREVNPQPAY